MLLYVVELDAPGYDVLTEALVAAEDIPMAHALVEAYVAKRYQHQSFFLDSDDTRFVGFAAEHIEAGVLMEQTRDG